MGSFMSSSSLESNTLLTLRFSAGAGGVDLSRFTPSGALSIRTKLQRRYEIESHRAGLSAGEGGLLRVNYGPPGHDSDITHASSSPIR